MRGLGAPCISPPELRYEYRCGQAAGRRIAKVKVTEDLIAIPPLVEGTVLRSGDKIRITAQLIHAPTEKYLWA
jgi:hypothetical protein